MSGGNKVKTNNITLNALELKRGLLEITAKISEITSKSLKEKQRYDYGSKVL